MFTPEYLKLAMINSIGNTTKVYFGPSLNTLLLDFFDALSNKQISTGGVAKP